MADNQKTIDMFESLSVSQLQNIINTNPTSNTFESEMIDNAKEILERKKTELTRGYIYPPVTIKDIQMPFASMVTFMVKWVIASIPALIILFIIWMIAMAVLGGTFTAISSNY